MFRFYYLLLILLAAANAQQLQSYIGEVQVTSDHHYTLYDSVTKKLWNIKGTIPEALHLKTGDMVQVKGTVSPSNVINVDKMYLLDAFIESKESSSKPVRNIVKDIQSTTVILSFCNFTVTHSQQSVRDSWFRDCHDSLGTYIKECSHNIASFEERNNRVYGNVIDIPCQGTYDNQAYDLQTSCNIPELFVMHRYSKLASNAATNRLIMILPIGNACKWGGLANVGCSQNFCGVWLQSDANKKTIDANLAFHELGHTLYLGHANNASHEYTDGSCVMGGLCCSPKCLNAPNSYYLGWSEPVRDLKQWKNQTLLLNVWPSHNATRNFLKLGNYYISFRQKLGMDSGLRDEYVNKVLVHERQNYMYSDTVLLTMLTTNQTYQLPNTNITITIKSINPYRARVVMTKI